MASSSAVAASMAMSASPPPWAAAGAAEVASSAPPATRAMPPLAPRDRNSPRFSVVVMPTPTRPRRRSDQALAAAMRHVGLNRVAHGMLASATITAPADTEGGHHDVQSRLQRRGMDTAQAGAVRGGHGDLA